MVGVVAQQYHLVGLDLEVKATAYACKGLHRLANFFCICSCELCKCHCCDSVIDIDADGHAQFHVGHIAEGRDQVEDDASAADSQIFGVEIAAGSAICVAGHAFLQFQVDLDAFLDDQCATGLHQTGVVTETFQIGRFGAIDVQVVGVSRSNCGGKGAQVVERTVELVGLDHHIVAIFVQQIVCAIVLGDTTQEGVASHLAFVQQVCQHRRRSRFAVRAGYAQTLCAACEQTEYVCSFLNFKTLCAKPCHFFVVGWYGWGVDHQRVRLVAKGFWYQVGIVFIMQLSPFCFKGLGQFTWGFVVTAHRHPCSQIVAQQSTHTYAAGTDKIDRLDIFKIHYLTLF